MARGRPPNPYRQAAIEAGEKYYADEKPCICGTNKRYTSNKGCVACAIARGNARYAALDEQAKTVLKQKDHERYIKQLAEFPNADRGSSDHS